MSSPWRKYCIPHLSNDYQASPYHPHRMEQKKAIRATTLIKVLGKPTLSSAQAKRVDALGIKFEDESVSGEHHHGSFPYSLERPIASHCGRS